MEKVNLVLSEQQLAVIAAGLQELPYRVSKPVLEEMQRQVSEQVAAFEAAKKESAGLVAPDGKTPIEVGKKKPRIVKAEPEPLPEE